MTSKNKKRKSALPEFGERTTALPSGYVGIHRAGSRWQAYAIDQDLEDLVLLGT